MEAEDSHYRDFIFKRLDGLVKQALDWTVKEGTDKFLFLLGSIMWYLGCFVPLRAGSAMTTEEFILSLLKTKNFSTEQFALYNGVPWFFLCKIVPRSEFVKIFPAIFEKAPQMIDEMKAGNQSKFKLFDNPSQSTNENLTTKAPSEDSSNTNNAVSAPKKN